MNPELEYAKLVKNDAAHRFELTVEGAVAFIDFKEDENAVSLIHTEVPPELGGKGVGTALVEKTLDHIEKYGKKVQPLCPFVAAYIKRNPEWQRVVA